MVYFFHSFIADQFGMETTNVYFKKRFVVFDVRKKREARDSQQAEGRSPSFSLITMYPPAAAACPHFTQREHHKH